MGKVAVALVTASVLVVAGVQGLRAQCPPNAAGGPDYLVVSVGGPGSDLDLGWKGEDYHNLPVPQASEIGVCLQDCDTSADPVCAADGGTVTFAGVAFGPPVPIMANNASVCLVLRFTTAPNGTANVQTGEVNLAASLSGGAFVTFFPTATTKICPRCSGATVGASGVCDSGLRNGQACVVDDEITVTNPPVGADPVYRVSSDCLPSGAPAGSVALDLTAGTGAQSVAPPCPGQASLNGCSVSATCTGVCSAGASNGGVTEVCCSDDDTRPCFPSPIERTGSATAPTPAWPDATYPKSGDTTLVSVFCAPATGNVLVDPAVGLPGPVAMTLPGTQAWSYSPEPPPTTTTSAPATTTTTSTTLPPGGCVDATDCADGDPCTDDQCNAGTCANPLLAGLDGARCRLDQTRGRPLCDPIDPAVQTALAKKLAKASAALARAAGTTKAGKQARQKRIARASLRAVTGKAARFAGKGKISAECAQAIADAMAALEAAIGP